MENRVTSNKLQVTSDALHVTRYALHVTRFTSLVTRHVSRVTRFAIYGIALALFVGCVFRFSLTGGTVDPNAKTVFVATFPNNASLVNPNLSQEFTTELKNRIQSQTPLTVIATKDADYLFEGAITNYTITPVALQGDDKAAMNRLTISVRVTFKNTFDETLDFTQTFSRYSDYLSDQNFTSLESSLMQSIVSDLTEDIYNKAFVNW